MLINPTKPKNIHILVSCRKSELERASSLVFDSLRVGFPDWPIFVWDNFNSTLNVKALANKVGATYKHPSEFGSFMLPHWEWIRCIISEYEDGPFCLVDTDVVFFENIQFKLNKDANIIGEYIPNFFDPITKRYHVERIHTAVMMLDAGNLLKMESLENRNRPPTVARVDLVTPQVYFARGTGFYYDTLANAYHRLNHRVVFEMPYPTEYVHLHCGSWMDHVGELNKEFYDRLVSRQAEVMEDPEKHYIEYRKELVRFYQQQQHIG